MANNIFLGTKLSIIPPNTAGFQDFNLVNGEGLSSFPCSMITPKKLQAELALM